MTSALLNPAAVTAALVRQIGEHPEVHGYFKAVERGEYTNRVPARTPWCGVYKTNLDYVPRVLGHHPRTWEATLTVKLVVQAHEATGEETEDALEDAIKRVLTAVLSDLTALGEVEMLKSMAVEYSYDETQSETLDFQWAFVTLNFETRTGA